MERLARVSLLPCCYVACVLGISPCKTSGPCRQGYYGHTYNTINITAFSCRGVMLVYWGICRRSSSSFVRCDLPDVLFWWFRYLARSEVLKGVLMTNQVYLDIRPCLLVIFFSIDVRHNVPWGFNVVSYFRNIPLFFILSSPILKYFHFDLHVM